MKKITKNRFDAECARRAPRVAEFRRKAAAFMRRNAALLEEFTAVAKRAAKAAERASKLAEDYWDDLYVLTEGTEACPRERRPVPGVEDLVARLDAWAALGCELEQTAARLGDRGVDLVPELARLARGK